MIIADNESDESSDFSIENKNIRQNLRLAHPSYNIQDSGYETFILSNDRFASLNQS
jgi:hypothetical protein